MHSCGAERRGLCGPDRPRHAPEFERRLRVGEALDPLGGQPAGQPEHDSGRTSPGCLPGALNVACDDVAAVAPLVLRHRLVRSFYADADGKSSDDIVRQVLAEVPRNGQV